MAKDNKKKRFFRRYGRKTVLSVRTAAGATVNAQLIDYSLSGFGVIMDSDEGFRKGDIVGVDVDELGVHEPGRVQWVQRLPAAVKVGISRVGGIKGSLRDYRLADLLIGIQGSLLTGTLEFTHKSARDKIFISKGDILFSTSDRREYRMGFFLLSDGLITREQFSESAEIMRKTGNKQGRVLVELGYLKPSDLVSAVRRRAEKIIVRLFSVDDGEFRFTEGPLPSDEIIPIGLSAANIIYRGIKETVDPKVLSECCPNESAIDFSQNPLSLFQDIKLDEADKAILSYVNGRSTVGELMKLSPIGEEETLKGLYALLETEIIVIKGEGESPHGILAEDVLSDHNDEDARSVIVQEIDKVYDEHLNMGYYGILDVKDSATNKEIKRAYYRAAKKYHPDRHFRLSEEIKGKLHEIFTFVAEAQATLANPDKRRHYDRTLKEKPERSLTGPERAMLKFKAGRTVFEDKEYEAAAQLFAEATYLDGGVADYHYFYGLSLLKQRKLKDAERALSRAHRTEPENPGVLAELGHVYLKLGFPKRARGNFEKAIAISSSNRRAQQGMEALGVVLDEGGPAA